MGWVMQMCMVRAGRELLRGLTVSSWEVNPSLHTLPMLPPQAKLPLGQGPLEISESWEICVCVWLGGGVPLGRGLPGYQKVQQSFPGEEKGVPWEPRVSWT